MADSEIRADTELEYVVRVAEHHTTSHTDTEILRRVDVHRDVAMGVPIENSKLTLFF